MRLLLTGLAALTLAGCQPPASPPVANDSGQPNEAVVEDQLENEQAAESLAIENDALADNSNIDND